MIGCAHERTWFKSRQAVWALVVFLTLPGQTMVLAQDSKKAPASKSPPPDWQMADQKLQQGRYVEAIRIYQRLMKSQPKEQSSKHNLAAKLAYAQLIVGRDEDAGETMQRIHLTDHEADCPEEVRLKKLLDDYRSASLQIDRATKLLSEKDDKGAISAYKLAVQQMPQNAEFHLLLAYAYRAKYRRTRAAADWREALREFEAVKRLDPDEYRKIRQDATKPS